MLDVNNIKDLPQVLLITGKPKSGKKVLATQISQKLLETPQEDLYLFGPSYSGKKTFTIEEVRSISQESFIRPKLNTKKVFILDSIEKLSPGAGEALLKLLEEPSEFSYYLLITSDKSKIIPTILSRAIEVKIKPKEIQEVSELLKKSCPNLDKLEVIANLSDGYIGRALEVIEQDLLNLRDKTFSIIEGYTKASDLMNLWESPEKALEILFLIRTYFIDLLHKTYNVDLELSLDLTKEKILEILELTQQYSQILESNVNHQLQFKAYTLKLFDKLHHEL